LADIVRARHSRANRTAGGGHRGGQTGIADIGSLSVSLSQRPGSPRASLPLEMVPQTP
jgi:hypothetical protein